MVLLAINTGLRCGELFNLDWQDIDFHQKISRLLVKLQKVVVHVIFFQQRIFNNYLALLMRTK